MFISYQTTKMLISIFRSVYTGYIFRLNNIDPLDLFNEKYLQFISKYKFVIAFENAICDDYISEKFWRPLIAGAVPIYFGSPTIEVFAGAFYKPEVETNIL